MVKKRTKKKRIISTSINDKSTEMTLGLETTGEPARSENPNTKSRKADNNVAVMLFLNTDKNEKYGFMSTLGKLSFERNLLIYIISY
jgi:hypothetical protein